MGFSGKQMCMALTGFTLTGMAKLIIFIYSIRPGQLTVEVENKFNELLNQFIKNYKLPMSAEINFAQCSPVTYTPSKK